MIFLVLAQYLMEVDRNYRLKCESNWAYYRLYDTDNR